MPKYTANNNLILRKVRRQAQEVRVYREIAQIVNMAAGMEEARAAVIEFAKKYSVTAFGLLPYKEEATAQLFEFNEDRLAWEKVLEGKAKYVEKLAADLHSAKGSLLMTTTGGNQASYYMGTIADRVTKEQLKEILGMKKKK